MFSITPVSRMPVLSATSAARLATACAAFWGVVTSTSWGDGKSCPSEMATSPVPGGMSTTRWSISPQ